MVSVTTLSFYPKEKNLRYLLDGPHSRSEHSGKDNIFSFPGIEPQILECAVSGSELDKRGEQLIVAPEANN